MFDATTAAAYATAGTPAEKAQAVRDSLGSGTKAVELRRSGVPYFSGTFSGSMVAGEDGSLSADVVLDGLVSQSVTPNAETDTCHVTNGARELFGSFGPGGRFTSVKGDLVAGQSMRLNVSIAPAGTGSALPLWRQGQAVNEWREIAGSAMSLCPPSVNPGRNTGNVNAKIQAWCGLSIDTRSNTLWSVANGGHDDYHGNEVNRIRLDDDAPAWIEVRHSDSAVEFVIPQGNPRYTSGNPASTHSYYSQQVIESRNMAMRFGLGAVASYGYSHPTIDGWAINTPIGSLGWSQPGDFPDLPFAFFPDVTVVKNPTTEDVYVFLQNYYVGKWTNATNTVAQVQNGFPPDTMSGAAGAFDTTRGRILLINDKGAFTFDPATGKFTRQTLSGSGAAGATLAYQAMVYVPALDAFFYCRVNGAVYRIDPATFEVTQVSVTGATPPMGTVNAYSRFLYAPRLGGIVWVPLYAANAFFLRVH